jgi:hypothetical protein
VVGLLSNLVLHVSNVNDVIFKVKLLDAFPKDAGKNNPGDRIIPFLPGKASVMVLYGVKMISVICNICDSALVKNTSVRISP